MFASRFLSVFFACTVISACKIQIVVPEGGYVTTESGAYFCHAGHECMVSVVDLYFDETFLAVPDEGYEFSRWKKRDKGFCGGNKEACYLTTASFGENEGLLSILESDDVYYLQPEFRKTTSTPQQLVFTNGPPLDGTDKLHYQCLELSCGSGTRHFGFDDFALPKDTSISKIAWYVDSSRGHDVVGAEFAIFDGQPGGCYLTSYGQGPECGSPIFESGRVLAADGRVKLTHNIPIGTKPDGRTITATKVEILDVGVDLRAGRYWLGLLNLTKTLFVETLSTVDCGYPCLRGGNAMSVRNAYGSWLSEQNWKYNTDLYDFGVAEIAFEIYE